MKTLCYMLLVILSVIANKGADSFIEIDDTRRTLVLGDAPYFVTIFRNDRHVCNGVILTEKFVLTASDCILQDFRPHSVVYGTIQFDSDISSNNRKEILNVFDVKDINDGENNKLKKYIRRNKYTDRGHDDHIYDIIHHNHDHNNDDNIDYNYDDDDMDTDSDEDYDLAREHYLSLICVVEVEPFTFSNSVNKIILPEPFEDTPSDKGTLVFRSADESLQSQQFPSGSEVLSSGNIELYDGRVSENEKHLVRGSPFVINDTLYGLVVVEDADSIMEDTLLLISIPHVIDPINEIIQNE